MKNMNIEKKDHNFITNEEGNDLLSRFQSLINDTKHFDVLVGYFYISGFNELAKSLLNTEKIRILVGINTDKETLGIINTVLNDQIPLSFSHKEAKENVIQGVKNEIDNSSDDINVEDGIKIFKEWIISKKIEVRAYPDSKLHAKLYIMTFKDGDRDTGRVITGSSNFTKAGLSGNLEFNVELSKPSDYSFALEKFDQLWEKSVDIRDSYIDVIENKSWLKSNISPFEIYLKFLYEYFKEDLSYNIDLFYRNFPEDFKKLKYQEQAVINARKILDKFNGVFISDVVGLGKTYIAAMLASQLPGRNLVIASPDLISRDNPHSWTNVFHDFNINIYAESIGKLKRILENGTNRYENVFIDEAHKFRNEMTESYGMLSQICQNKKVILISATPLNNSPRDILSQIKLFQKGRNSDIPSIKNLDTFFNTLDRKLKGLDRLDNKADYMSIIEANASVIRQKVLRHLMIRRTRNDIKLFYGSDLKKGDDNSVVFPDIQKPVPLLYQLDKNLNNVFMTTLEMITNGKYPEMIKIARKISSFFEKKTHRKNYETIILLSERLYDLIAMSNSSLAMVNSLQLFIKKFKALFLGEPVSPKKLVAILDEFILLLEDRIYFHYARYTPLLFLKEELKENEQTRQRNMGGFMKTLLVKRLESSFHAFTETLSRFIISYDKFIEAYSNGAVFTSKKYSNKIIDLFLEGNEEEIQKYIDNEKAQKYPANSFKPEFIKLLKKDRETLKKIRALWENIDHDPKRNEFVRNIKQNEILNKSKIIVFTESVDTANYLKDELDKALNINVLIYHGTSDKSKLKTVLANFDPNYFKPEDEYRILITTDILAEGVNLHRSNCVVNYDIPWNPTRIIQRVGRINRVDTTFDKIYSFNFFPTDESNNEIKLKEAAEAKIAAFIEMLGNDAALLTESENIKSHQIWSKLNSKEFIEEEDGEVDSELKYLKVIENVKKNNPKLFKKIVDLPKKSRVCRKSNESRSKLITYFRKGLIEKFFITDDNETLEIDFFEAVDLIKSDEKEKAMDMNSELFFKLLDDNKKGLHQSFIEDEELDSSRGGKNHGLSIVKILKSKQFRKFDGFTESDLDFIAKAKEKMADGAIPKGILKKIYEEIKSMNEPPIILSVIRKKLPYDFLVHIESTNFQPNNGFNEIIISELFI